jgi:hypothetical protein
LSFNLGPDKISQTRKTKHLGIFLNDKLTDSDKVENATRKAKSSLFSLLSIKIDSKYLNPITSASLVRKICIPSLLFGCELWSNLKSVEINRLDRFQRLAAKKIQKFHQRTRTDICLSMLGWKNIIYDIDYRKLMFLCNLCLMPNTVLSAHIFNARLSKYVCSVDKKQRGFIPDIIMILRKYMLSHVLVNYIQTGEFPNKSMWKRICKTSINNFETVNWSERLNSDNDFCRFKFLHTNIEQAIIWECAHDSKTLLNAFKISQLWINKSFLHKTPFLCERCGILTDDGVKHCTLECSETDSRRKCFFDQLLNEFGQCIVSELRNDDNESKFQKLIGRQIDAISSKAVHKHFLRIAISFVVKAIK